MPAPPAVTPVYDPSPVSNVPSALSGGSQDLGLFAASLVGLVLCLTVSVLLAWGLVVALRWAIRLDAEERWARTLRSLEEEDSVSEFRRELEDL